MSKFDHQQLTTRVASDSVTAANNTNGLTVTLQGYGRSNVNLHYSVGSSTSVFLEGRNPDGANEWREITEYDTTSSNTDDTDTVQEPFLAYQEYRARVDTAGIAITLELSATR
jgi:hypothetical protein